MTAAMTRAARPRRSSRRATRPASRSSRAGAGSSSNVVASQVALHAPAGGIVPEVAARAHLRWILPVLDEAWQGAGASWDDVDAVAVTRGPGLAGSLLVGHQRREDARVGPRQAARRRQPPRGPRLRGVAARPGPGRRRASRAFPLVALVVSGGHTFLVEMTDHLTYRLLGQTVDDAAGEAFDKVGRLLGLTYPGGPAIQRAAEAARAGTTRAFPRAWLGDSYDFSLLRPEDRRAPDRRRGARRRRACASPRSRCRTP